MPASVGSHRSKRDCNCQQTALRGEFPPLAFKPLQRRVRAAVPEVPLCTAQPADTWAFVAVRQPPDYLFEILYQHGEVKPVEYPSMSRKLSRSFANWGSQIIGQLLLCLHVRKRLIGSRAGQSLAPADP